MTKFKIFQIVSIILIIAFLFFIVVFENSLVKTSLESVLDYCYSIEVACAQNGGIKNSEVVFLSDNLEYSWLENEENLCFLVNHKSIQEISVEISKLKTYLEKDDDKEFFASLNLVKRYADQYNHFMGANVHNIL